MRTCDPGLSSYPKLSRWVGRTSGLGSLQPFVPHPGWGAKGSIVLYTKPRPPRVKFSAQDKYTVQMPNGLETKTLDAWALRKLRPPPSWLIFADSGTVNVTVCLHFAHPGKT